MLLLVVVLLFCSVSCRTQCFNTGRSLYGRARFAALEDPSFCVFFFVSAPLLSSFCLLTVRVARRSRRVRLSPHQPATPPPPHRPHRARCLLPVCLPPQPHLPLQPLPALTLRQPGGRSLLLGCRRRPRPAHRVRQRCMAAHRRARGIRIRTDVVMC